MSKVRTLKFKQLEEQQTVSREPLIVEHCTFINHDDSCDAYLHFRHLPAANNDDGYDESLMDICVPAGAEVKIRHLYGDYPMGLYVEVDDHPCGGGGFGADVGPVEARFRVMTNPSYSAYAVISGPGGR